MRRAALWGTVGCLGGMLILAGIGAWWGFAHGGWSGRDAPGWESALRNAFAFMVFYGWFFGGLGLIFGGLTGLGSWLARPKKWSRDRTD